MEEALQEFGEGLHPTRRRGELCEGGSDAPFGCKRGRHDGVTDGVDPTKIRPRSG
jgi:hypothetical protein